MCSLFREIVRGSACCVVLPKILRRNLLSSTRREAHSLVLDFFSRCRLRRSYGVYLVDYIHTLLEVICYIYLDI